MKIAMIGAGSVGRALGGSLAEAGHEIVFTATTTESAESAAEEVGGSASTSNSEAAAGAEVVILAVPYPALEGVLGEVGDALDGKVVVDAVNRVDPDHLADVLGGSSVAELVQSRLPGARVVKAFNTVFASRQSDPAVDGRRADGYVAGDDEEAKAAVLGLVEDVGLRPLDAGPLVMARVLEGMALLLILFQMWNGWPWQSAWKLIGPTGE